MEKDEKNINKSPRKASLLKNKNLSKSTEKIGQPLAASCYEEFYLCCAIMVLERRRPNMQMLGEIKITTLNFGAETSWRAVNGEAILSGCMRNGGC
jgi:hypothetical protein